MQSRSTYDLQIGATPGERERVAETELNILKDVLRMLPAGITIQDEHGDFVLVN
jgi:cyclic di-GMP phosphodiesterase Gmr